MTTVKLVDSDIKEIDTIYKYDNNALNMALSCKSIIWRGEVYKLLYSTYDMDNKTVIMAIKNYK